MVRDYIDDKETLHHFMMSVIGCIKTIIHVEKL